jgi:XTP/dITP diphosphohydrolase
MEIVFASHNQNKIKEVQALLPKSIRILSLRDILCNEDIPETANTIAGNALLKAKYIKQHYGYDCFADDTGLEVDYLNGAPGVYSARYAGPAKNDEANCNLLLKNLEKTPHRKARFKTVICLIINDNIFNFEGIVEGTIGFEKIGNLGFGYDPIFTPIGCQKTFAEMTLEEKSLISHRGIAMSKLITFLEQRLD